MKLILNKDITKIKGGQLTLLKIEAYDNVYVFYIQEPGAEVEKYSFNILNYADRKNKDYNLMFIEKALKHIIKTYEEGQAKYILEDTTRRFEIAFEITNIRGSENKLLQMDIDISKLGSTRVKAYQPEIELVKERRQGTGQGDMAMRLDMDKMFNSYEFRAMMNDYRVKFYKQIYTKTKHQNNYINYENLYFTNNDVNEFEIKSENNQTDTNNLIYYYKLNANDAVQRFVILKKYERILDGTQPSGGHNSRALTQNNSMTEFNFEQKTRYKIFDAIIHILCNSKIISFNSFCNFAKTYYIKYIKILDESYKPRHRILEFTNLEDLQNKIKNISVDYSRVDVPRTLESLNKNNITSLDYFVLNKKLYKSIIILNSFHIGKMKSNGEIPSLLNFTTGDTTIYLLCEEI